MTTATVSIPTTTNTERSPLLRYGLATGVVAGVATTAFAAAVHAGGVPLEIQGEAIPAVGFGQLTLMATVLGIAIATLARRTRSPQRLFVQMTLALTALSFVPDITADATSGTKLALMTSHVIAAAIVIPRLARRLSA